MRMETILIITQAHGLVPSQTLFLPLLKPIQLSSGLHEELHFHLLKLTHSENELTCHDLVSKGFSRLRNSEWDLHPSGFLHVQVIDKNSLSGFWPQIHGTCSFCHGTHFSCEHQIELAHFGPIL